LRSIPALTLGTGVVLIIALIQGYTIGTGDWDVSIFLIQGVALLVFAFIRPEIGIFLFLTIHHFEEFLPEEMRSANILGSRTFGLNARNIIALIILGSWFSQFILKLRSEQRNILPVGRFGRIVTYFVLYNFISLLITFVAINTTSSPWFYDPIRMYTSSLRAQTVLPIIALLVTQIELGPGIVKRLWWFYGICFVGMAWGGLYTILFASSLGFNEYDVAKELRGSPISIELLSTAFFGVALALIVVSKRQFVRFSAAISLFLILLCGAYLRRRAWYLAVVIEAVLVMYLLMRKDRKHRAAAMLTFILLGLAIAVYVPVVVIERIGETITVVGSEVKIESSVSLRFVLWENAIRTLYERWFNIMWGNGIGIASTAIPRMSGLPGLSVHNLWLETLLDKGIIGVVITIMVYTEVFRISKKILMSSDSPYTIAIFSAIAANVFAIQMWLFTHTSGFSTQLAIFYFVWIGVYVTRMRPGGPLAHSRFPDGTLAIEYLGYRPEDHPEIVAKAEQLEGEQEQHRTSISHV
jgi:O-antigen ligase